MGKKSIGISNSFCPQTLFLYGTYKEDGTPNFGLFCWLGYYWDAGLGIMACISENKLTRDRILANGVFSANLVTEKILPLADYFGNKSGYDADKMKIDIKTEKGQILNVPVLAESPVAFELEVAKVINLDDGMIFLCKIKNVLADESLADNDINIEERMKSIAPVCTTCQTYFNWNGEKAGCWGDFKDTFGGVK